MQVENTAAVLEDEPRECLYAMDEAEVMLPYEWCATSSQARYRGWRELDSVGMTDEPFDPRTIRVRRRWMFRYTADPWAELTHRFGDAMTPGAFRVWHVQVGALFARRPLSSQESPNT